MQVNEFGGWVMVPHLWVTELWTEVSGHNWRHCTPSGLHWDRYGVHGTRKVSPGLLSGPLVSAESRARTSAFRSIPSPSRPLQVMFAKHFIVYRPLHPPPRANNIMTGPKIFEHLFYSKHSSLPIPREPHNNLWDRVSYYAHLALRKLSFREVAWLP